MSLRFVVAGVGGADTAPKLRLWFGIRIAFALLFFRIVSLSAAKAQPELEFSKKIDTLISQGLRQEQNARYSQALKIYSRAARVAHKSGDSGREARAWLAIGSAEIDLRMIREALNSNEKSYRLGIASGNKTWAGGAAGNLAAIYRSLGEFSLAEREGRESLNLLEGSYRKDFLATALIYLADLAIEQGRFREGIALSDRAVDIARTAKLSDLEACSWDIRGYALIKANDLSDAADALSKAQAVREHGRTTRWLPVVLAHRSELELKRGNYIEALALNRLAFLYKNETFKQVPAYYVVHVRAQILLALGEKYKALSQFRRAVNLANSWRKEALPGDASNVQTVVYLNEVYHDFAQVAAERALAVHDSRLSRDAWKALADNRAASLAEQLRGSLVRDPTFGNQYLKLLASLVSAQARVSLGGNHARDREELRSIRLDLSALENQSVSFSEKGAPEACKEPLECVQAKLGRQNAVMLSFCFGETRSYVWTLTAKNLDLHEVLAQGAIDQLAQDLTSALQSDRDSERASRSLSSALFSKVSLRVWRIHEWLLVEDGPLAGKIPFSALQDLSESRRMQPIVINHSLRTLPSELLVLIPKSSQPARRFVGVADPIYNQADSRWSHSRRAIEVTASPALGRLPASANEVEAAAKLSGMPEKTILLGHDANGTTLRAALAVPPELLHFAVHVISPDGRPEEAALALSLADNEFPELLTREVIAAYRVPGSLVVLSGCASGQGRALPSTGLIGLSRAWLLAGAAAVVVSSWTIPDDHGEFFGSFYTYLRALPGSTAQRAAIALEKAQCDMQASHGYRSLPSFWAAFTIVARE